MKYHLHSQGQNAGVFALDELRRKREAGELTGAEFVWCQGMAGWEPLDAVLLKVPVAAQLPRPPPLPARTPPAVRTWAWALGAAVVVAAIVALSVGVQQFARRFSEQVRTRVQLGVPRSDALELAARPLPAGTNSLTETDVRNRGRGFRVRQWVEGYEQRGRRQHSLDADALLMLQTWLAHNHGGTVPTNKLSVFELGDKLAAAPDVNDALVLTGAAVNCGELHESIRRFERALKAFAGSEHRGYPKLYANVMLAKQVSRDPARVSALDAASLDAVRAALADGSVTPQDEEEVGDIFVRGWGEAFFHRQPGAVVAAVRGAGQPFEWLALVLEGEQHIIEGWKARGGGYANTVSDTGWQEFHRQMGEARRCFTRAWALQAGRPLAPARMVYVAMGDAGLAEMRTWFDRTLAIQIDHPSAWSNFRWGLRPRWFGDHRAMRALGLAALDSQRFDTDVPRFFMESVSDIESEMDLPRGQHIYGRADIWPNLKRMYEGYLAEPTQAYNETWWRTAFAVAATFAGQHDVARTQLEKLDWQPLPATLTGWGADVSLLPLEVAARTGSLGGAVAKAEAQRQQGNLAGALKAYSGLAGDSSADERTRKFIRQRVAALEQERRLAQGEWVEVLPTADDDPNWVVVRGQSRRLPDGTLEITAGAEGHYCHSRVRVGQAFEVKGEFEVMRSSTKDFQAGLIFGIPDLAQTQDWYGFRLKRNQTEDEVVSFSRGWSTQQFNCPVPLSGPRHTFNFRYAHGQATATVNGQPVFQDVAAAKKKLPKYPEIVLGVGAFNDQNETVIQYRGVQVRKLAGE